MAFYYSRRKLKVREPEETGELNIVPYLDILMNLIMFMLMSISGLASLGILNVTAPSWRDSASVSQPNQEEEQKLLLTVLIGKDGFVVATNYAVQGQTNGPSISRKADGAYDYEKLSAQLVATKDQFPKETKVIIGAEGHVPYDVLIQTMDAVRETPGPTESRRLLFPDVTLAAM
jgi:biopolymer transport protein TolR